MSRALTSHEVARLAGVSQATVSRVLRDDQRVRPATRERVLRVLAETKYEPNAAARAIRGRRTGSIGVVVARLSYQLYPAMLEAIGAQLARLDRRMIVWDAEHGGDQPAVRALRQGIVDGVILTAATAESQFLKEVHSPEAPVVLVNRMGVPFLLGLPLAFLFSAALGAILERTLYVHVYSKSHLDQVLFTIGLVFMSVTAVDYVMGSSQVFVQLPSYLQGQFDIFGVGVFAITDQRLADRFHR